jgi:two-component system chemotaxis response regulator CheB
VKGTAKPIRVMIVEDSRVAREFLAQLIDGDRRLEVVAAFDRAETALRELARVSPDVISMDIHLPGMSGLEATKRIMETHPTPVVIVSRSTTSREAEASIEALRAGALTVAEKPAGPAHRDFAALADRLCTQLVVASGVRVVRQRFNRPRQPPAAGIQGPPLGAGNEFAAREPIAPAGGFAVLGIVASTGGPNALETILSSLGEAYPLPILLVQHITANFHAGFVQWLERVCPLRVSVARPRESAEPGRVYVAPADMHLRVSGFRFVPDRGEPVGLHRPSGTVLFASLAESWGKHAVGVLLTGMGEDGAAGLLAMRKAGAYTIAEDASTAVVNGMPEAARFLGAVSRSLPLDEIGPALKQLGRFSAETRG